MHVVGGLDRDSAGVEGDALPDKADVVALRGLAAAVTQDDEARLLVAALRDGEVTAHAQRATARAIEDLDRKAGLLRERASLVREQGRRHLVRRFVREAPLQVHRVPDGLTLRDR